MGETGTAHAHTRVHGDLLRGGGLGQVQHRGQAPARYDGRHGDSQPQRGAHGR